MRLSYRSVKSFTEVKIYLLFSPLSNKPVIRKKKKEKFCQTNLRFYLGEGFNALFSRYLENDLLTRKIQEKITKS